MEGRRSARHDLREGRPVADGQDRRSCRVEREGGWAGDVMMKVGGGGEVGDFLSPPGGIKDEQGAQRAPLRQGKGSPTSPTRSGLTSQQATPADPNAPKKALEAVPPELGPAVDSALSILGGRIIEVKEHQDDGLPLPRVDLVIARPGPNPYIDMPPRRRPTTWNPWRRR